MGASRTVEGWGTDGGARLRRLREDLALTEADLALHLSAEIGVKASQASVSRWEKGAVTPRCAAELVEYMDAYAIQSMQGLRTESGPAEAPGPSPGVIIDSDAAFARLAEQATGEPLLGPAQLDLVRGMNKRLENGPPLSPADRLTYLDQLRILGVPLRSTDPMHSRRRHSR